LGGGMDVSGGMNIGHGFCVVRVKAKG
jgi:hypothetical protein